jgi:GTP-binding protein HflX
LDASQPDVLEFYETTLRVLNELGAEQKDTILVFNKVDRLTDESVLGPLRARFPEAHFVSVHTGRGLESLLEHMAEKVSSAALVCSLCIPLSDGASLAKLHRAANILEMEYEPEGVRVTATLSPRMRAEFGKYLIGEEAKNSPS